MLTFLEYKNAQYNPLTINVDKFIIFKFINVNILGI